MKEILLASSNNGYGLVSALPRLFHDAGIRVTVISAPHWSLANAPFISRLIEASLEPERVLEQVIELQKTQHFDAIMLCSDELLWALWDSQFDLPTKARLCPFANLEYFCALNGKVGVANFCKKTGVLSPHSISARTQQEVEAACDEIGYPFMLKVSRSSGGTGVFKPNSSQQLREIYEPLAGTPILVEKFIEGDTVCVEPLFLGGQLISYNYSIMSPTLPPFGPSLERLFKPCPEIEPILQKIGKELQFTGFANVSFIREFLTQDHYLIEMDLRPNRWVGYGKFAGVECARAIRYFLDGGEPHRFLPVGPKYEKKLRQFPGHFLAAIEKRSAKDIFYWVFNRNGSWKHVSLYGLQSLSRGLALFTRKIIGAVS